MPNPTPGQRIGPNGITAGVNAWITPSGAIHFVENVGHCSAAMVMGDPTGGRDWTNYVHLSGGMIAGHWEEFTQAQIDSLFDIWQHVTQTFEHVGSVKYFMENFNRFQRDSKFFR